MAEYIARLEGTVNRQSDEISDLKDEVKDARCQAIRECAKAVSSDFSSYLIIMELLSKECGPTGAPEG
jgi:hypothetical protein